MDGGIMGGWGKCGPPSECEDACFNCDEMTVISTSGVCSIKHDGSVIYGKVKYFVVI
jgi:hypothetical protein